MSNIEKTHYWLKMRDKAARNLATVSECTEPEDEKEVKDRLCRVLKHGGCCDAAEAIMEAAEWAVTHLELKKLHEDQLACTPPHGTPVIGIAK